MCNITSLQSDVTGTGNSRRAVVIVGDRNKVSVSVRVTLWREAAKMADELSNFTS